MTHTPRVVPRRERLRAATIDEIKQTALRIMRESGSIDIRFTDIARAMDLTPPALYRYFADRDALLNALIADAYTALGREVAAARETEPADNLPGRWMAIAQAYRRFARREPQQFTLIFGLPLPGYVAPQDGPTTEAAHSAMGELAQFFLDARRQGRLGPPFQRDVTRAVATLATERHVDPDDPPLFDLPPETFQAMMHVWAALHGFVTLEAYCHFDWMPDQAREDLFASQMRLLAQVAGIPVD